MSGPVTYSWQAVGLPLAAILHADTATPIVEFTSGPGQYTIQLTVTNAAGQTSTAALVIQFNK